MALEQLGLPLSISHKILPEFRGYERASTVVANALWRRKWGLIFLIWNEAKGPNTRRRGWK